MGEWLVTDRRVRIVSGVAALAALQATLSCRELRGLEYPGNYDTAYYYTVARNFASGRGLTETVLWHYLGPIQPIEHPAGDYWLMGWSLFLGTLMRGFGHSGAEAMRICAALSVLLPILAFWLAWHIHPRLGTSLLAGLLVCAQLRLFQSNVTPDVTLCYQVFTLLGLGAGMGALNHDRSPIRLSWTGALLALPIWVRGEGFMGLLAVILALLAWGRGSRRRRVARAGWIFLGATCGVAPLFLYHLAVFGRLNPLPRLLLFWARDGDELYRFDTDPSFSLWLSQGVAKIADDRYRCLYNLTYQILIQITWPLLVAAGVGMLSGLARRRVEVLCLALFLALSAVVPPMLVPFGTNPDRLVMHAIPVLCVLAASAVGDLAGLVRGAPRWVGRTLAFAASVLLIAGCILIRAPLNSRGHFEHGWKAQFRPVPIYLAAAAHELGLRPDDVVLTQDPWQVAAVLDVRTVMIPYDGPDALERVIERYRPRFALLPHEKAKEANPKIAKYLDSYRKILKNIISRKFWSWTTRPGTRHPPSATAPSTTMRSPRMTPAEYGGWLGSSLTTASPGEGTTGERHARGPSAGMLTHRWRGAAPSR